MDKKVSFHLQSECFSLKVARMWGISPIFAAGTERWCGGVCKRFRKERKKAMLWFKKQKAFTVEKTDVCVRIMGRTVHYPSLLDAVQHAGPWPEYDLAAMVLYNVQYRDCLRSEGMEGLKARLLREAPVLAGQEKVMRGMEEWVQRHLPLADFDIQCYNIHDVVTIEGFDFCGWQDVHDHIELMATKRLDHFDVWSREPKSIAESVHVGCLYASYPTFDSSDWGDDRTYDNYLIRRHPITESEMEELSKVKYADNYQRVNGCLPAHLLPVLYYKGDGDCMLLATAKHSSIH